MAVENAAAELGPSTFPWWPDWRGKTAAIIASGPSTKKETVELLLGTGIKCLAIKQNYDLCPWADIVYGCDAPWWQYRRGLPEFKGLKLCYQKTRPPDYPHLIGIDIDRANDRILTDKPGLVGSGGNSGFQATNLVVQFGAKRILGIGFDALGDHWYGRNNWARANNPDESLFKKWRRVMEGAALEMGRRGIEFINCSPKSTINNFRKASVSQMLNEWELHAPQADPV